MFSSPFDDVEKKELIRAFDIWSKALSLSGGVNLRRWRNPRERKYKI